MNDKIKDGGPAFPRKRSVHHRYGLEDKTFIHDPPQDGMSLRDWFAGMALQGVAKFDGSDAESLQKVAEQAYQYANAMLAERNKEKQ